MELRGDCREGSRPLGLWFLQKHPGLCQQQDSNHFPQETPVQYSSPARHTWIAYFGQEALSTTAPNLPLVLQSSSKKKKKYWGEYKSPNCQKVGEIKLKQTMHRMFKILTRVLRILSTLIINGKFSDYSVDICISVMMQQCLDSSVYNSVYKLCIYA